MMKRWLCTLTAAMVAVAGVFLAVAGACGEECALTLKRFDGRRGMSPVDYQIQAAYPQSLMAQFTEQTAAGKTRVEFGGREDHEKAFKRIVKKEPAKYECKHPFRGVVKLGGQEFGFVFDAVGAKSDEAEAKQEAEKKAKDEAKKKSAKAKSGLWDALAAALTGEEPSVEPAVSRPGKAIRYNRLYFDANHNGDLTDDPVIASPGSPVITFSSDYAWAEFPAVTVPLEAAGVKYDYRFTVSIYYNTMSDQTSYASASFNAAAYREGEITLDGKKRRVVLVDFNSNGRFDDAIKVNSNVRGRDGEVSTEFGDVVLLDPQTNVQGYVNPYDASSSTNRYLVSKLVDIEGKFYHLAISPSGDKLSLSPATPALGYVTNANAGFSAVLYGNQGFLKIHGDASKPVAMPEGSWKLLSYTIDLTNVEQKKKPAEEARQKPAAKPGGLLSAIINAVAGSAMPSTSFQPYRFTRVSAHGTQGYTPIEVRKGKTTAIPFGPPYKPMVRVDYAQGSGQVRLGMTLVGSAGERCTDMMVQGSRPSKPEFTIKNPRGEVVYRGSFEYG